MGETTDTVTAQPPRTPRGPRPYVGRLTMAGGWVATGLVLVFTIGVTRPESAGPAAPVRSSAQPAGAVSEPPLPPGAGVPGRGLAAPEDRPRESDLVELGQWAQRVSKLTSLPARQVSAYGRAEMWMRTRKPDCRLGWTTLAGIGQAGERRDDVPLPAIDRDGRLAKPMIGPARDGSDGLAAVPDTDGGRLDGDPRFDHPVGPLQLLPATWTKLAERASGDGGPPDPQDLDDAAFTAARSLCSSGADLSTPTGWWGAVQAYGGPGDATAFAEDSFAAADSLSAVSLR